MLVSFSIWTTDISHVRADSLFQLGCKTNKQKTGLCGTSYFTQDADHSGLEVVNPHMQLQDDVRHEVEHASTHACQY
jgi:hypothetical protein